MSAPKDPEKYKLWKQHMSESRKGRKVSDIGRKHMSECKMGKSKSETHKQNISKSCKGRVPWNLGIPHTQSAKDIMSAKKKGIPLKESHKKHLSESHKGQKPNVTPESKEKNRLAHLGKRASEETKLKMSKSRKGRATWNKGIPSSEETKKKQSDSLKGKPKSIEHRKNMRGERNHNWKGGVSKLEKSIRELPEMYIWKYNVMKRDNFCDCFTGILGNHNLEVHHIKPLSIIIQECNIKTIEDALKCEELWDIENGITMFKESHVKHHQEYGLDILPKEYFKKK